MSHFRTLLAMLTKINELDNCEPALLTITPWPFRVHLIHLILESTTLNDSIDLLSQFQNTVSGIYSKHSVPGGRMLRMKCNA